MEPKRIKILISIALLFCILNVSAGMADCYSAFNKSYDGCAESQERAYAVATAGLSVCMAGGVDGPLAPGVFAACTASYLASTTVADMNFGNCVDNAGNWYYLCHGEGF